MSQLSFTTPDLFRPTGKKKKTSAGDVEGSPLLSETCYLSMGCRDSASLVLHIQAVALLRWIRPHAKLRYIFQPLADKDGVFRC
jgi:hypothetical protein